MKYHHISQKNTDFHPGVTTFFTTFKRGHRLATEKTVIPTVLGLSSIWGAMKGDGNGKDIFLRERRKTIY